MSRAPRRTGIAVAAALLLCAVRFTVAGPAPRTTTLGTGTDPAATTIAPGTVATDVNAFTLETSAGIDAIDSVTVNLSTGGGVQRLQITDGANSELGAVMAPASGPNTITVTGMSAGATPTTFKVRVTPYPHSGMPPPPGGSYSITAAVTSFVSANAHAGSDSSSSVLTIDNQSPLGATATSGSAGAALVTLDWTTSVSSDFSRSVVLRWADSVASEAPAEGADYVTDATIGAATVACVRIGDPASNPVSGVDGGGSGGCSAQALDPSKSYTYKVFQRDGNGNYDVGTTIGTFAPSVNPPPTTTGLIPSSQPLNSPGFALTVTGSGFVMDSLVNFDGAARTTTYVSATQLSAQIMASDLKMLGAYDVTVYNPSTGSGSDTSNVQTFTVTPGAPTVVTGAATGVTAAAATLQGTVTSNGAVSSASFEYGLSASYGNSIAANESPLIADAVDSPVSADLIGLNCGTLVHYRVVGSNSAGTSFGTDNTFTTSACSAPFPATACAATRFNGDLNCTSQDVSVTGISLSAGSLSSCVSGETVTLDLDLIVNFASPTRYDVGIFIANDGKLPTLLPANGGAGSCSVDTLPIITPPSGYTFPDIDGAPQGTADTCGDGSGSINGGTGGGVKRMTGVMLPCYATPESAGKLFVPFVVSWDNLRSPIGNLCTSSLDPVPSTSSKCNAPLSDVAIDIVVKPVITNTDGRTTINPGENTTYTITIFNDSGGTLLDTVLTDPAVTNLTVNSVSCAPFGGAICPATTVADMQGAGILIPSTDLPNDAYLVFTVDAKVSASVTPGDHVINTATATVTGGHATSASDDDLVVNAPSAAKSFAPNTITEGASSVLTVTLSNPTGSAATGVTFTDTYPSGLVNTAPAGAATTCGGTVVAVNGGNSLSLSGGTIPISGSCTVTVNVTSATAGTYYNTTGAVATDSETLSGAAATLTVDAPVYGNFNACDDATDPNYACTEITTATESRITTKVAGTPFTLDLVALKSDGTWNSNYGNDVIVELLDASDNSGALDGHNCRSTWTSVIATLGSLPDFAGSNGQISTATSFTVAEAFPDVRVRITSNGGATRIGCSTDDFAIRPGSFTLDVMDADWENPDGTRVLDNVSISPRGSSIATPVIHKAGRPFTVKSTAKNSASDTTTRYTGTPAWMLSDCSPGGSACTSSFGAFEVGGAGRFVAGVLTSNGATYSDAGAFDLRVQDSSFAVVDAPDTAGNCSGRYICSASIPVGRFVPDHFEMTGIVMPADSNGFSYMDEHFAISFTLTAKNANGATTARYSNSTGLARLDPATDEWSPALLGMYSSFALGAKGGAADLSDRLALAGTPSGTWSSGVATVLADLIFSRPAITTEDATWGPYDTVEIGISPYDDDGITLLPEALDLDVDGDALSERTELANTTGIRFGRLRLVPGQASGFGAYALAVEAQYWSGAAWITTVDDTHTTFTGDNVLLSWQDGVPSATLSQVVSSVAAVNDGFGEIVLSSPGGHGTATVCLDLSAATTDCTATTPGDIGHLGGNWSGSDFTFDPYAEIEFGRPRPDSLAPWGVIYQRENY